MADFEFQGRLAASKSIMNRALIVQSYAQDLQLVGDSSCDDVVLMKQALQNMSRGERHLNCGHAGTVLRFLALRVSRQSGEWLLTGSPRLMSRPQTELLHIFQQLGVQCELTSEGMKISGSGWQRSRVEVSGSASSQFLSSLLLNSWNLPQSLEIKLKDNLVSQAYFELTEKMVRELGLHFEADKNHWKVFPHQLPRHGSFEAEPDMSSCFAIVACAVMAGNCGIENFPSISWQPDSIFKMFFKQMAIEWQQEGAVLSVNRSERIQPLTADVNNSPDLVPVLSVLLARAQGISRLTGFEHLVHKESNRLQRVMELLQRLGRHGFVEGTELIIEGKPEAFEASGTFDPDEDHRMAMAAQVANWGGAKFQILQKDVVNKSFPEFWSIAGGR